MRGSQSSATQVDDCWKTSKRGVILPQAMWEVQAIREEGKEKLSRGDEKLAGLIVWSGEIRSVFSQIGREQMRGSASILGSVLQ